MEEKVFTLNLTIQQINVIMQALGRGAYVEVAELVDLIRGQVQPQIVEDDTKSAE